MSTDEIQGKVIGTSLVSFDDAAVIAFREIPGDPSREGIASATVVRMWMTKGGIVGRTQFHVELVRNMPASG